MRKEIYEKLTALLTHLYRTDEGTVELVDVAAIEADGGQLPDGYSRIINHVDLWNRNVEFIEQETAWERPAVFIEFAPVRWRTISEGEEYRTDGRVLLHIVTDWTDTAGGIDDLDLSETIHAAVAGLYGDSFSGFDLAETHTNHDHEEIVESIDIYSYDGFRRL